ncbi:hypothetical protein HA402_005130 [Bradysia odoriphaga]|nr:hypothetical protein HA402_005130 [Bradysia odoriphaga]
MLFKALIFALCLKFALCFYNGAPTQACLTLEPNHGSIFPIDIPVNLELSSTTVRAGYPLPFQIISRNDSIIGDFLFRGFIIQARLTDPNMEVERRVVGTFDLASGSRYVDCPMLHAQSTLTHSINTDRSFIGIVWRAPAGMSGITVRLEFSIVMNVGMYWTAVSPPITVTN